MFRTPIRVFVVCLAFCLGAGSAGAFDVQVDAPKDLVKELRTASLTASLADTKPEDRAEGESAPQPIDILSAAQADYGRLIALLYDQGYFGPTISILVDGREAAEISPIAAPASITKVVLIVAPGDVFRFGDVSISPSAPIKEPTPKLARGKTARVSVLRSATAAEIEGWRQAGHAKVAISGQKISANHPEKTLNTAVALDPGPRLRLGKLTISGDSAVREKRIREIAGWPSGEVFDPDTLVKVQKRFRRTGTFANSTLTEAEAANPDDTLDVEATVIDQPARRYSFGAEYGSLDGLSLTALWLHRNIFGGAERLQIQGEVKGFGGDTGGIDFSFGARLSRPATFRTDLEVFGLAEFEQRDDQNLFFRSVNVEVGGVYFASDHLEYSFGIGVRSSKTRDDLGDRNYTILTFPYTATLDLRDDKLDAKSGYYAHASVIPFANLGGTGNGVVTSLDLRNYHTFGERFTLALRGQVGSLAGPSLATAPADLLFFSGGSGTVRGQGFQSLGTELSPGVTIGGRSFLGLASEMRVKTTKSLSVVGFFDLGYIGPDAFFGGGGEWHSGFGAGVRYDTSIGPIRFDVGFPASGPDSGVSAEIYIGIGQAF